MYMPRFQCCYVLVLLWCLVAAVLVRPSQRLNLAHREQNHLLQCVTATRVIPSVQLLYICHNIIVHEEAMLSPN